MATLSLEQVTKVFANGVEAVSSLDLSVEEGEFVVLVGPSGCGKTTALRMVAGLEGVTSGTIRLDGKPVNDLSARERDVAMVFQNYALYPHLTVFENIAFPLRLRKLPDADVRAKVTEAAQVLELTEHLDRKPAQLSGGQRQRVAMGRAIVRRARAFLFDEPLSNLDAKLRGQMRTEISRLRHRLGVTTVYVTHDQVEAMTLGDRLAVLRRGSLQQVDTPRELYERPVNLFVAGFIGSPPMNFLPALVHGHKLSLPFGDVNVPEAVADRIAELELVLAGIRPEHFADAAMLEPEERERGVVLRAGVDVIEWLGSEQFAYVPYEAPQAVTDQLRSLARELDSESMRTQLVVALDAESCIRRGEEAELWFDPARMHLFDPATGENLTRER